MKARKEIVTVQAVAFILLIALAFGVVAVAMRTRTGGIDVSLEPSDNGPSADDTMKPISDNSGESIIGVILDADTKYDIDRGFIGFCANDKRISPAGNFLSLCLRYIDARGYRDSMWENVTGYTFSVLYDVYTGRTESPDVTVLGDVWSPHKTTFAITGALGGGASPELAEQLRGADIFIADADADLPEDRDALGVDLVLSADAAVEYYISGGTKTSVCRAESADDLADVAEADANSDLVIVMTSSAADDLIRSLADSGADVVVSVSDSVPLSVGYYNDCAVVLGLPALSAGTDRRDTSYLTVTASVGLRPTVRIYPCVADGGIAAPADGGDAERIISDINSRSDTAYVADDNRVREQRKA